MSPAPVAFADDLQVLTVDRSAKKGTPIGQIKIANPGRRRLTWTMRHRYRYGGKSFWKQAQLSIAFAQKLLG